MKPLVAIVGRPNVGKSTLFNRLIGGRAAIVDDQAGVTRDRIYRDADWNGRDFILCDTGGLIPNSREEMANLVKDQSNLAIEEADVIIFLVDGKAGVASTDEDIANVLRRLKKPVILTVNKIDDPKDQLNLLEFYQLGMGDPMGLSALRGSGGVGDLLDEIVSHFPAKTNGKQEIEFDEIPVEGEEEAKEVKLTEYSLAIVGRPNVGKSSIVNVLCGKQRSIVTAEPGTTRDALDTKIEYEGKEITIVDTAGIRRKSKVDYGIEAFSVVRSIRAIDTADVVVLMLDATQDIADQDQKIGAKIEEAGKAVVIVINKWDLINDRSSKRMNEFIEEVKLNLRHLSYAEVVFTSAITKQRVTKILEAAERAVLSNRKRFSTNLINQVINEAVALTPPPSGKRGKKLRVYYTTQVSVSPPTFILFVNDDKLMTDSYHTYIERKIRESCGFAGTPIRIFCRPKVRDR